MAKKGMPQKKFNVALAALTKKKKGAMTDAVKYFWDYVKKNDLQNPDNKREIILDAKIKALTFPAKIKTKKTITMFQVGSLVNANME